MAQGPRGQRPSLGSPFSSDRGLPGKLPARGLRAPARPALGTRPNPGAGLRPGAPALPPRMAPAPHHSPSHTEAPIFKHRCPNTAEGPVPPHPPRTPGRRPRQLPSRRGCCSAGRSAGCRRTAPAPGSTSAERSTSASTRRGLARRGPSVCKTGHTRCCQHWHSVSAAQQQQRSC